MINTVHFEVPVYVIGLLVHMYKSWKSVLHKLFLRESERCMYRDLIICYDLEFLYKLSTKVFHSNHDDPIRFIFLYHTNSFTCMKTQ